MIKQNTNTQIKQDTNTQVEVGQIWEDSDSRRKGRTFKVINIEDDTATCKNLTGAKGSQPAKPISFIKLKRFVPRYYKLHKQNIKTFSVVSSQEADVINTIRLVNPAVVRRQIAEEEVNLLSRANEHWNLSWRKMGNFIVTDNDMFDISIRNEGRAQDLFDVRVKLFQYTVFSGKVRGSIEKTLDETKKFLYNLKRSTNNLLENG
jgi:hypothetical protein